VRGAIAVMHAVSHLKEWEISKAEDKKHFQVNRSEAEETLGGRRAHGGVER
jgi:hypothetical protein